MQNNTMSFLSSVVRIYLDFCGEYLSCLLTLMYLNNCIHLRRFKFWKSVSIYSGVIKYKKIILQLRFLYPLKKFLQKLNSVIIFHNCQYFYINNKILHKFARIIYIHLIIPSSIFTK